MNKGIVVKIDNLTKHPNADKLQIFNFNGANCITDLSAQIGDVVILFDDNLALSDEYCKANNLYPVFEEKDGVKKKVGGGFIEESNRRIKPMNLRSKNLTLINNHL